MTNLSYGPFISQAQAKAQGLMYYFTGKLCRHGHTAARYLSNGTCKTCNAISAAKAHKKRAANPVAEKQRRKAARLWSKNNKVRVAELNKKSTTKRLKEGFVPWHVRNRDHRRLMLRKWEQKQRDIKAPRHRLRKILAGRLYEKLKARNTTKQTALLDLVGCEMWQLVEHIESQWQPGMSWENWTRHGWHIDHIRPIASFEDPADPACWHYTNLQPLWAADNLRKSDTWEPMAA